jgi:hypothetical protein
VAFHAPGRLATIVACCAKSRRRPGAFDQTVRSRRGEFVSSLLGVLGITLVLFFVVALTARLILGR